MKNFNNMLDILFNDESLSQPLSDFSSDSKDVTIEVGDFLYIGRDKPFNTIFISLGTSKNTVLDAVLNIESFIGSWEEVSFIDDTKVLTRDGFVYFKEHDRSLTIIGGLERYWYRLSVDKNLSKVNFNAINILFSDDKDLKREFYPIDSSDFKQGASNFNLINESVRDSIIQMFRNKGLKGSLLSPWDIIDIEEVRLASTYLALSKIFKNVSDTGGDNWDIKSKSFEKQGLKALELAFLTFFNEDGQVVLSSNLVIGRMTR